QLPFDSGAPEEIMMLHRTEPPPPVRLFRPEAPVAIEQLVERMLAKESQFRPRTATEAAEIFERAISSPDQARTPPVTQVITKDGAPVITVGKSISEQPQPHVLPTQIEQAPVTSGRVTTPVLPDPETPEDPTDHTTHETQKTRNTYRPQIKWI